MNYEKEILEFVKNHPGCVSGSIIKAVGHPNAGNEANYMVKGGQLDRWYSRTMPHYYIAGTYTPKHMRTKGRD